MHIVYKGKLDDNEWMKIEDLKLFKWIVQGKQIPYINTKHLKSYTLISAGFFIYKSSYSEFNY